MRAFTWTDVPDQSSLVLALRAPAGKLVTASAKWENSSGGTGSIRPEEFHPGPATRVLHAAVATAYRITIAFAEPCSVTFAAHVLRVSGEPYGKPVVFEVSGDAGSVELCSLTCVGAGASESTLLDPGVEAMHSRPPRVTIDYPLGNDGARRQRTPNTRPSPPPAASAPPAARRPPPPSPAPGKWADKVAARPSARRSGAAATLGHAPSRPPRAAKQQPPSADGKEKGAYQVWFATNRKPIEAQGKVIGFSGERDKAVHRGWCRVSIPASHRIGSTGSPWWKRLLTLTDDRLRIQRLETVQEASFWKQLKASFEKIATSKRDAVVFVHGYNVSFEAAALRAAQLGFDLGVSGAMAFYSWPSQGNLANYTDDEASIEASESYIADFLASVVEDSGAERVHIIAHSMGNRGLLRAMQRIVAKATKRAHAPFGQVILAAADVDADVFEQLSAVYAHVASRTTMYVCSKDLALEASHWLHGFRRAGLAPPVLVVPGIDTINVSNVDLTLLGHGYVAEARDLLGDMYSLLTHGSAPDERFNLMRHDTPNGRYWAIRK